MSETLRIEIWARLLKVSEALRSGIEADLKAAGLPSLEWYDALLALARAEGAGLRQFELRRQVMVPQYTLSRLVDRLEAAGLVVRRDCPEDGRGKLVSITDRGLEVLDDMWPVYRQAILARFSDTLDDAETERLGAILRKLLPGDVSLSR